VVDQGLPCRVTSTQDRRGAARANRQAAAFLRFQLLGDAEGMSYALNEAMATSQGRLSFITAMGAMAGQFGAQAMGEEPLLAYLKAVAQTSAALEAADDIDSFFDSPPDAGD
jgi:hypothetical protein